MNNEIRIRYTDVVGKRYPSLENVHKTCQLNVSWTLKKEGPLRPVVSVHELETSRTVSRVVVGGKGCQERRRF